MFKLLVPIDSKIIPRIRIRGARHLADFNLSTSLVLSAPSAVHSAIQATLRAFGLPPNGFWSKQFLASVQDCATLLCAKTRGFSLHGPGPNFLRVKLADFALYKTRIFTKTFGIYFPTNKRFSCLVITVAYPISALSDKCSLPYFCRGTTKAHYFDFRLLPCYHISTYPTNSVADPWHFGVDPDPDPRIHASD